MLVPLSKGQAARYQRFDWDRQQLAEWHDVRPGGYLIIEGFSASRREFRPYLALQVWVATARDVCLRRGLERDGSEALEYWRGWQAAEDAHAAQDRPEQAADLVVSGEDGEPWSGPNRPDKPQ